MEIRKACNHFSAYVAERRPGRIPRTEVGGAEEETRKAPACKGKFTGEGYWEPSVRLILYKGVCRHQEGVKKRTDSKQEDRENNRRRILRLHDWLTQPGG